jgi:putative DNA methylase
MQEAFQEARRLLKPGAPMVCVYAHKTTVGWSTLINALRIAGFSVVEAWPVEMERKVRQNALETAALASSILLVTRRREGTETGSYENVIRPELEAIVRERVETLWAPALDGQGIQGADLVVAAVGAGLKAFTRFARVEFENGEEVPAERFLAEVETVVLETILSRLSKEVGGNGGRYSLAGLDPPTRFYVLWRYTYRWSELDAGEAIVFANGTHVELDGPGSLSYGAKALVTKKKDKYKLRDNTERGDNDRLGVRSDDGQTAPVIDALHRTLWLMENKPTALADFLREAQPNREQMRLVAQALAGPALRGSDLADVSPTSELAALAKLTANWRSVIEDQTLPLFR